MKLNNRMTITNKYVSPWSSVKKYEDLLDLNLKFIHGKINQTPYHCGPLVDPSPGLIKNLDQLHRYGLFTVNGQESVCEYGKQFTYDGEYEQRGYLEFFTDPDVMVDINGHPLIDRFIEKIKESELVYVVNNIKTNTYESNLKNYGNPENKSQGVYERYNLTRVRRNIDPSLLSSGQWKNNTNINFSEPRDLLWRDHADNLLKNSVNIFVALREYGKGVVEEILINICRELDVQIHELFLVSA